jgi:hypothetical protein
MTNHSAGAADGPRRDGLRLTPEERARHAALSPVQVAWLDFVAAHPEALQRSAFAELDAAVALEPEKIQPWPLFLDRSAREPIVCAGLETLRLVRTVPQRIFDNDPERLGEFYGLDEAVARGAARLLAAPGAVDQVIARGDFLLGPQGFACCELNVTANLGGWQVGLWKELFLEQRLVAAFLAAERLRALPLSPVDTMLDHAAEVGVQRGLAEGGELNLAVVTYTPAPPDLRELFERRYREALARRDGGLAGRLVFCTEREMTWEGGRARFAGMPVQLFLDQPVELVDGPVFRAQAAGRGFAFNGLMSPVLSDKRNLALLSEQADGGDLYDAEERAAIARHIPWTRLLADGFTDHAGERVYLPDLVRAERERLVIKPPDELGGKNVCLGVQLTQAEWEARLDAALAQGRWIVQELIPSESFLFQAREGGAAPHDLVWGAFLFGDRFGSCLVRGAPAGAGVVNVGRGASRIVLLEVEDEATLSSIEPSRHEETCDAP